jgi:hypothetical protein
MRLHQLKVDFNAEHDRLLMRVSTSDAKEVLLWLTRRCVKLLWPAVVKMMESSPQVQLHASTPEARAALLGFEHEKALQQADFSKTYEEAPRERPLGAEPILVARIQTRVETEDKFVLTLLPLNGQGVHLTFDVALLHSFGKLLQSAVAKAQWDFKIDLPEAQHQFTAETSGERRLN